MSNSLVDYLKEIPDPRKAKGKRDEIWQILLIVIMAIMSGHQSIQGWGRFAERHRRDLIQRLPSYSTMRRVMMEVDYEYLNGAFIMSISMVHLTNGRKSKL
jgi:hypothetical protein